MDASTVRLDDIYKDGYDEQPPFWLDVLFILTMTIIHISYSFKFSKFSLAYLNAKCEEKKSRMKWSTSRLYLHAIKSSEFLDNVNDNTPPKISTKLWSQMTIVRYLVRILMFVLCWVVLILYITLQLNITFEYLVACIVNYKNGSFLALIVFPALFFVNIGVIRYIFYGIMASWSINLDEIADEIAYEQQHKKSKEFAFKDTKVISDSNVPLSIWDDEDDDNKNDNDRTEDIENTKTTLLISQPSEPQKSMLQRYKELISQFKSPYWMAVQWRLLTVFCSVLATIFALPSISTDISTEINTRADAEAAELKDSFWFQIFLRYMLIATASWLIIYFLLCIAIGSYGRISTLSVYSGIIDENNRESRWQRFRNQMLRFFCLMDAFGLEDTNKIWKRCKFIQLTVIFVSGVIFVGIWPISQSGLLWFIGVVQIFYYGANILLTTKPRGLHYLWKSDMVSLELMDDIDGDGKEDWTELKGTGQKIPQQIQRQSVATSHAANVRLSAQQMRRLMGRQATKKVILTEFDDDHTNADNDDDINGDAEERALIAGQQEEKKENDDVGDDEEEKEEKDKEVGAKLYESDDEDNDGSLNNEEQVISLFNTLYNRINNDRRKLYEERQSMGFGSVCIGSICFCGCCGCPRPINLIILINYIYSVMKQYKGYWLLILPYNYDIRPLSVLCSGRSVTENIIKYDYKNNSCWKTCHRGFKFCWNGIQGILCCIIFVLGLVAISYLSIAINQVVDHTLYENGYNDINITNTTTTTMPPIRQLYPICDLKWNANLSVMDLTSLAHMAYDIGPREQKYNKTMQDEICVYFDRKLPSNIENDSCSWRIINYTKQEPVFMHLRHDQNNTDVIVIRGTKSQLDFLQDFSLFNQVALVQLASWIIPITSLLPTSFIIRIVYFMSLFEGSIDTNSRGRYDEPVFKYSYQLLINTTYKIDSLYFIGHSLGGGVSQAVAGQINHLYDKGWIFQHTKNINNTINLDIKSFSMASPGMVFNSRKFSLDIHDLFVTATILKPRHDAVSNIDIPGGLVQNVECDQSKFISCHKTDITICELIRDCNVYNSHNPHLIQKSCMDGSKTYMEHLNESTMQPTTAQPTVSPTISNKITT